MIAFTCTSAFANVLSSAFIFTCMFALVFIFTLAYAFHFHSHPSFAVTIAY